MIMAQNVPRETHDLDRAAQMLNITLTPQMSQQLLQYAGMIQKWNKTYNITAIRELPQILNHHIYDSMAVQPAIQQFTASCKAEHPKILDVGSGGGLPGVVLAILNPHVEVSCLDAVQKKSSFITMCAGVLGLKNLRGVHARIEHWRNEDHVLVISRAFASLKDFASWSGHCVGTDGRLAAMKAQDPAEEIQALEAHTDWMAERIEPLQVPELAAQRCLVWMKKKQ